MQVRFASLVLLSLLGISHAALAPPALAQAYSSGLISPEGARQVGLERMWFTQLGLDRGRGRVAGVHQHVSSTKSHTVFEIKHAGKRYVFSEWDRDAFGDMIGIAGAQQKADEQLAKIKLDLEAAGQKDPVLPTIDPHVVPEIRLYSTSERGLVHAIDGETGQTLWISSIGSSRFPSSTAAANDAHVAVLNGSTLYMIKADDGNILWSRMMMGALGAGPAMSDLFVFVPMLNGAVESYEVANPKRPVGVYRSFGRIFVQPVASFNSVAWPAGSNLYVGFANVPGMRYRVEAKDEINSAPAFMSPDKIFATSLDGYIYCVHEEKGNVLWRFTTGEPISHSPIALGDTVYAITDRGNMYAVNVADAQERWMASGIRGYLSGNENRLYCVDLSGNLIVLDTKSGSRIGSLSTSGLDLRVMNVDTDRIIVGSTTGLLQCFRETTRPWPTANIPSLAQKKPAGQPGIVPGTPPGTVPVPPADPFGTPATPMPAAPADPFADPAAAKPATPAAPAVVDPFAM